MEKFTAIAIRMGKWFEYLTDLILECYNYTVLSELWLEVGKEKKRSEIDLLAFRPAFIHIPNLFFPIECKFTTDEEAINYFGYTAQTVFENCLELVRLGSRAGLPFKFNAGVVFPLLLIMTPNTFISAIKIFKDLKRRLKKAEADYHRYLKIDRSKKLKLAKSIRDLLCFVDRIYETEIPISFCLPFITSRVGEKAIHSELPVELSKLNIFMDELDSFYRLDEYTEEFFEDRKLVVSPTVVTLTIDNFIIFLHWLELHYHLGGYRKEMENKLVTMRSIVMNLEMRLEPELKRIRKQLKVLKELRSK